MMSITCASTLIQLCVVLNITYKLCLCLRVGTMSRLNVNELLVLFVSACIVEQKSA